MGIGVLLVDSKCLIKKVSLSLGSSSRTMEGSQVWLLNSDDSEPSGRPSEESLAPLYTWGPEAACRGHPISQRSRPPAAVTAVTMALLSSASPHARGLWEV